LAESTPAPRTAQDLLLAIRKFKSAPDELTAFIRRIPTATYRGVIKSNLDGTILHAFAVALKGSAEEDAEWCKVCLEGLVEVDRFGIMYSMLPKGDKDAIRGVKETLRLGEKGQLKLVR
jgi:hypothetical protein